MSTTHGQPGLSSDQRSTIRSAILSTRHTLEDELRRQLEKYGIYEAKKLPLDKLTHLSAEEIHTRRTLDAAIERELESTEGDLERSITNYVREATKTYLNRFVALKTIEVRDLVEETITERPEYGNRSYMHHTVAEIAGELTNAPDDGFGASLELAFQEIGAEIRMIFEESEHTAIDLDVQVREDVLDELDAIADDAWESDEALGWVYQYFGEDEREEIDERVDKENYKIAGTDIATKTQLFTPRYIVEWMVDNSLGRMWLEMQDGKTNIADEEICFNLAPVDDSLVDRDKKSVEEVTVLDPACGSGHMLSYAFDVLYQMYLEEGKIPEKYIPREILRNNLYGIDIDSGAAQIAALSLYLKAKEKSPNVEIPQLNINSADTVLINGDRKQELLSRANSELEENILEQIWTKFQDIRELGSLIRIEEQIDDVLEEYRQQIEETGQTKFTSGGDLSTQTSVVGDEGGEETWEQVKVRLLEAISNLATDALEHDDPIEEMFTDEVDKSVRIVDCLIREYDIVITNPPYLGSGKMGDRLRDHIRSGYVGKRDTYAAFIERCNELTKPAGYTAMITIETFMYQYVYRGFRPKFLEWTNLVDALHLSNRDEAYMNIAFISRSFNEKELKPSRFIRLVEQDNKVEATNNAISTLRSNDKFEESYIVDQRTFKEIDRTPFLYWFGSHILDLFADLPSVEDRLEVRQGLATGDDDRFVRKWWELPPDDLSDKYVTYQKSGSNQPYYDAQRDYIYWENDGEAIKDYDGSRPQNQDYYFREGTSFRGFGNYAVARLKPDDTIFYHKSHFAYSPDLPDEYILGYGNSTLARFLLDGINPSQNFEVGDIERLPIDPEPVNINVIIELVQRAMRARESIVELDETADDFFPQKFEEHIEENPISLLAHEDRKQAEVGIIHGTIDEIIFDAYEIPDQERSRLYESLPKNLSDYPTIPSADPSQIPGLEHSAVSISMREDALSVEELKDAPTEVREAAESLEVSPLAIASLRYKEEIYANDRLEKLAGRLLSYCLGRAFGRWESDRDNDILVIDDYSDDSLVPIVEDELESLSDDAESIITKIESWLGRSIAEWFHERFFRHYHCKEYRRRGQRIPVYWHLASENEAFSCYINYYDIGLNMFSKLRGQYVDSHIDRLENTKQQLREQMQNVDENKKAELSQEVEQIEEDLEEITNFRKRLDTIIDDGFDVDLDHGIWTHLQEVDEYNLLAVPVDKL